MQPTGTTFDSFRQSPGISATKGAWGQTLGAGAARQHGGGQSRTGRKKTLLGLAIMAGMSTLSWVALFALTGLI